MDEYGVKMKVEAESSSAEKSIDGLKDKLTSLSREAKSSAGGMDALNSSIRRAGDSASALDLVKKAVAGIKSVISGFGLVGLVMAAVNAFEKWRAKAEEARRKTAELWRENMNRAATANVEAAAAAYRRLGESIASANRALERQNDLQDLAVKLARERQDAEIERSRQSALAGLDANDADYGRKADAINRRYDAEHERLAGVRGVEDAAAERTRSEEKAKALEAEAAAREKALGGLDGQLARSRAARATHEQLAKEGNEKDAPGLVRGLIGSIFGTSVGNRTEEGDAVREEHAKQAREEAKRTKALEEKVAAERRAIAEIRAEAEHQRKRAGMLDKAVETSQVKQEAATLKTATADAKAEKAFVEGGTGGGHNGGGITPADYSDAFAKRGLIVGAQVDTASVNDRLLEVQKRSQSLLQGIYDNTKRETQRAATVAAAAFGK